MMTAIIGWIGTALVLASFLMRDMLRLRITNSVGCLVWVMYGLVKQDLPIVVTNLTIVCVHSWYLYKNYKK